VVLLGHAPTIQTGFTRCRCLGRAFKALRDPGDCRPPETQGNAYPTLNKMGCAGKAWLRARVFGSGCAEKSAKMCTNVSTARPGMEAREPLCGCQRPGDPMARRRRQPRWMSLRTKRPNLLTLGESVKAASPYSRSHTLESARIPASH
jgi:hypothetical protein